MRCLKVCTGALRVRDPGSSAAAMEASRLRRALALAEAKVADAVRESREGEEVRRALESAEGARAAAVVAAETLRNELRDARETVRC